MVIQTSSLYESLRVLSSADISSLKKIFPQYSKLTLVPPLVFLCLSDPFISPTDGDVRKLVNQLECMGFVSGTQLADYREQYIKLSTPDFSQIEHIEICDEIFLITKVTSGAVFTSNIDTSKGGGLIIVLTSSSVLLVCSYPGEIHGRARVALGMLETKINSIGNKRNKR